MLIHPQPRKPQPDGLVLSGGRDGDSQGEGRGLHAAAGVTEMDVPGCSHSGWRTFLSSMRTKAEPAFGDEILPNHTSRRLTCLHPGGPVGGE